MTRQPIRQLSPLLVNRIAAGEVIERPASVVKELVENALDAGATNIVIEIEDGGRELIRVIDDGGGIPPDELPLAFASHATSKLATDEDLFRIRTMGFRGEALASIGSISQSRIVSRQPGHDAAKEITNDGGEISPIHAASANVGTTVEVRHLFFNTPARRKFMRSTSTEFSHISQTVLRLALPFEGVAFRVVHNGRTTLELPPAERLSRLLEAWPAEFREHYLLIDEVFGDAGIVGIAGLPELARPTPAHQYLYLNGRSIRDKFISHALREAYRGLTEPGRHPAAVLLLTLPPDEVDVNVHPTKSEVRFRDGTRVHGLIQTAVRRKLSGSELAPSAVAVRSFDESREDQKQSLQSKLADFFKQPPPLQPPLPPLTPKSPFPTFSPSTPSPGTPGEGWGEGYAKPQTTPPTSPPTPAPSAPRPPAPRIPAIQLHNSYLVAESDDGLIIIDQHALHERIIYEELLDRVSRGPLESQRLLIPQTLAASARQLALLEQIAPLLRRLGIEAEPFGPDSVAVNAFPSFLSRLEPGQFVADLLDRGEQETLDLHDEELLHEVLDMMSCKAAVKAGEALSVSEIEALLARRSLVERASNCPHGRPTTLRMSLKDLEKQFKRTGF